LHIVVIFPQTFITLFTKNIYKYILANISAYIELESVESLGLNDYADHSCGIKGKDSAMCCPRTTLNWSRSLSII